jgi:hypothetical protein
MFPIAMFNLSLMVNVEIVVAIPDAMSNIIQMKILILIILVSRRVRRTF